MEPRGCEEDRLLDGLILDRLVRGQLYCLIPRLSDAPDAVSYYIAEWYNTLSNLFFIALALFGWLKNREQRIPGDLAFLQLGIALVGIGSFAFHATLRYDMQLADELPMIYASSMLAYAVLTQPLKKSTKPNSKLPIALLVVAYDVAVTVIYTRFIRSAVFHQLAYALIQATTTFRTGYLWKNSLKSTPIEDRLRTEIFRILVVGSVIFISAFAIWNANNLLCVQITQLQRQVGPWLAPLLEGHAWWHLGTGYGSYLIVVGTQALVLAISNGADGLGFRYWGGWVPYVIQDSKKAR